MSESFKQIGPLFSHGPSGKEVAGRHDRLITENTIGGPLALKDVRMYLDRQTLEFLLSVSHQSLIGRVRLDHVGLKIKGYRATSGHTYETWTLISAQPVAESSPVDPIK
jgi:hypothetical protein